MNGLAAFIVLVIITVLLRKQSEQKKSGKADPATYPLMRNHLFKLKAKDIKLPNWDPGKPFCVIMETGYPGFTVTFLAVADGSTSIYLSNGGGFIGAGEFGSVRAAVLAFVEQSAGFLSQAQKGTDNPLPSPGQVTIYFKTPDAFYSFSDSETNFGENKSPLSELFYGAQTIIGYIRQIDAWKKSSTKDSDAAMNADFIHLVRASRKKPMGEMLLKIVPMLMKSEMVFPKHSVERQGDGEQSIQFITKKDDDGKVWFQGYSNVRELLQVFPPGTPYVAMNFSDFFKAIESRPDVGGIAINGGAKDTVFMVPEPLFSYFRNK